MPRLPGAQDIRQVGQPRASVLSVPRPDTSGLAEVGRLGEQITSAAMRIQKREDATNTTLAENEFVSEANREWARLQVEDDPARPEFTSDWHSWLEERAKQRTSNLQASEEAKTDFSIRLSSRVLTYRDKGFTTQLDAQRTKSKEAVGLTVNRVAGEAMQNPEQLPAYLDEAQATVLRFKDTLSPEDERSLKRGAVESVVTAAVKGYLERGEIAKAREVVRAATGVPGEEAGPVVTTIFSEAEKHGVDPLVLAAIGKVESGFDPNAKAKTSSAAGIFQFTNSTGTRFGLPSDARKASVEAQSRAAARLTLQNIEALRSGLGGDPSPGEIYLAHFLGAGDAVKVLGQGDDTPLSAILSPRVLEANPFLKNWDVAKLSEWAGDKMRTAMMGLTKEGQAKGRVVPWQVFGKTTEGRPIVFNPEEGGLSTEFTVTVPDPREKGKWINIPSLFNGQPVEQDQALAIIEENGFVDPETGRSIESFGSVDAAEEAAMERTASLDDDPAFQDAAEEFNRMTEGSMRAAIPVDKIVQLHKDIDQREEKLIKEAEKRRDAMMSVIAPTKARPDVDPVGVLAEQSPQVAQASAGLVGQIFAPDGSTKIIEEQGDRLLEFQVRTGVVPGVAKLFSNEQAQQIVRRFETMEPDEAAISYLTLKQRMGKHWPRAYKEMVEQGMPSGYVLMGVVSDSGVDVRAVAETVRKKEDELRSAPGSESRKIEADMLAQVETEMEEILRVFTFGAKDNAEASGMLSAVRKVALDRYQKTGDPISSARYATSLITKRFDVLDGSNKRVIIPVETGLSEGEVSRALDESQSEGKLKRFSPVMLDTARPDFLDREAVLNNAVSRGVWVTNEDGTGAVLLHQFPGGGTIPVRNARGERYEVMFDAMRALAEQNRPKAPRGPMSPPTTFSGLTPEIARERMRNVSTP